MFIVIIIIQCPSEGSTVKEKIVQNYVFMQCSYSTNLRGSYENFPAVAWSPRKRSPSVAKANTMHAQ